MSMAPTHPWRTVELGQIASFVSGGTPSRKTESYFTGTIPWLTGYDISEDQVTDIEIGREYITEEAIQESATNPVEAGTILLTTRVTVGKVGVAATRLCFSQDITGIVIHDTKVISPVYLATYLLAIRELLLRKNRGSTIQGIIRRDLVRLPIPLPTPPEQQRIIDILRQAEELRQIRRRADERIRDLQASLYLKLFGDPFSNPMHWEEVKLKDAGILDRGRSRHRPRDAQHLYGGPYPFVQTGDVANSDGWITEYSQTYSEEGLAQSKLWSKGTLCITIAANIAKTGILTFDACFPDSVVGFTPKPNVKVEYVRQWLEFLQKQLDANAPQGAQKNINLKILRNLKVPLPPPELQEEYAFKVQEIRDLQKRMIEIGKQWIVLKQSILTRAFSGELTASWREANAELLHDAEVEQSITLGERTKEPRPIHFETGEVTRAEWERFEQVMRASFYPAVQQLSQSVMPNLKIQDLAQGPLLQMSQAIAPLAESMSEMVNNSLARQVSELGEAPRSALAAAFQPLIQMQAQIAEQIKISELSKVLLNFAVQLSRLAAEETRQLDDNHPRYHALAGLSDEQYWVYLAARRQQGYFTPESLSEAEGLPYDAIRTNLPLLETLGLITRVTVVVTPSKEDIYFVDAFRKPGEASETQTSDLTYLKTSANQAAGTV